MRSFYWSVVFMGQAYFQQKLDWGLSPILGASLKMVAPGPQLLNLKHSSQAFCVHEGKNRYRQPLISISGQPCLVSQQLILKSPDEPLCCVMQRDLPRKKIIGQCQSFWVNLEMFVAQAWASSPGWYWTTQEWFQTPQALLLLGWQHMSPFSH